MRAGRDAAGPRKPSPWVRGVREILAWALPGALLVLVPKCPACLAAYVTLGTGLGLTLAVATGLRWALLFLGGASLVVLIVVRRDRIGVIFRPFQEETERCNIR